MGETRFRGDELPRGMGEAAEVPPTLAASVLVMRPPYDVLMIRRHERSSFVPNAWVFPGGAVDGADYDIAHERGFADLVSAMRVTAVRELFEETGLWIGAPLAAAEHQRQRLLDSNESFGHLISVSPVDFQQLVWTSHWITPVGFPKRFDTYFFLARSPEGAIATAENAEAVEVLWISPDNALARNEAGDFPMVFPTIKNLEALRGFESIDDLFASRAAADIPAILPTLVPHGDGKRIVLP